MLDDHATDYHISKLIESSDDRIKTLVAEVAGKVVGFMSLSSRVDYNVLAECYHLEAYESLLIDDAAANKKQHHQHHHLGTGKTPNFMKSASIGKSLDNMLSKSRTGSQMLVSASKNQLNAPGNDGSNNDLSAARERRKSQEHLGMVTAGVSMSNLAKTPSEEDVVPNIEEADRTIGMVSKKAEHRRSFVERGYRSSGSQDNQRILYYVVLY